MTKAQALKLIYADLRSFKSFSEGNIASVEVKGDVAYFDLKGAPGFASDWLAFNDDAVGVKLSFDAPYQAAVTLGRHQLIGIRRWYAYPGEGNSIVIQTDAYEIANGSGNFFGTKIRPSDQKAVWDNYFSNIDKAYFGGGGAAFPYSRERVGLQSNPFERHLK